MNAAIEARIYKKSAASWKRSARRKRRYLLSLRERMIRQSDMDTAALIEIYLGHIPSNIDVVLSPEAISSDRR